MKISTPQLDTLRMHTTGYACEQTGRIDKHTQERLSVVLEKTFFNNERNQQKAIKLVRDIAKS